MADTGLRVKHLTNLDSKAPNLGPALKANSIPITLATDDTTFNGGSAKTIVRGGAKGTTTAADVTSTAVDANTQGLDTVVKAGQIAGVTSDVVGTITQTSAWELVTITFTPTETGVVHIFAEAYGGTTNAAWIAGKLSFS